MRDRRQRLRGLLLLLVLFKYAMAAPAATSKRQWGEPPAPQQAHSSSPPPPSPLLPDVDEENEEVAGEAVIQLAEALVNIESLSGNEQKMACALQGWLSKRGWEVILQPVPPAPGYGKEVRENCMTNEPLCCCL